MAAGAVQGYFGGATDLLFQRFIEIWSGMPQLYLLIILSNVIVPSFWWLLLVPVKTDTSTLDAARTTQECRLGAARRARRYDPGQSRQAPGRGDPRRAGYDPPRLRPYDDGRTAR